MAFSLETEEKDRLREALLSVDGDEAGEIHDEATTKEAEVSANQTTEFQHFPQKFQYFCQELGVCARGDADAEHRLEGGDGPLIIPLETTDTAAAATESDAVHRLLRDTTIPRLLYDYIRQWHLFLFVPVVVLSAFSPTCVYWWDDDWSALYVATSFHLILLWTYLFLFPRDPPPPYQVLQHSHLKATYLSLLFFVLWHVCGSSGAQPLQFSKFVWLSATMAVNQRFFFGDHTKQQGFILVCSLACPWSFNFLQVLVPFCFIAIPPMFGMVLVTRHSGIFAWVVTSVLSTVCPCLPVREIRGMELDGEEVDYEDEEAVQAKVDQQILVLGRPMVTSPSFLERGQKAFAGVAVALALYVLILVISQQSTIRSILMEDIQYKIVN